MAICLLFFVLFHELLSVGPGSKIRIIQNGQVSIVLNGLGFESLRQERDIASVFSNPILEASFGPMVVDSVKVVPRKINRGVCKVLCFHGDRVFGEGWVLCGTLTNFGLDYCYRLRNYWNTLSAYASPLRRDIFNVVIS